MKKPRNTRKTNATCGFNSVEKKKNTSPPTLSQRDRVLKYIRVNQTPNHYGFTAIEIAQMTDIPMKNVQSRLSELYRDCVLTKPHHGYYLLAQDKTSGFEDTVLDATGVLPRVQNLLVCAVASVGVGDVVRVVYSEFSLVTVFTVHSGLITCRVKCDHGLDLVGLRAVMHILDGICLERGYVDLEWRLSTGEALNDWYGLRLDGLTCVTLRDFYGHFVKMYNKPYGVRVEARFNEGKPSLAAMFSLLQGDIRSYNIRVEVERLAREVAELKTVLKYHSMDISRFGGVSSSLLRGQGELKGLLHGLVKEGHS